jgi:16S rRNA (guanine527-N7)-methyltransferase
MEIPQAAYVHLPAAADQLANYAELLAGPGVDRGLIGPREVDRLWDRHILNCAVVAVDCRELQGSQTVLDIGSGAGLPGVVWAIVRPELTVTLLDSMKRRTDFLQAVVTELDLTDRVNVLRARVEEQRDLPKFDIVTARAVAPLERLLPWAAPHVRHGGTILALKGESVAEEIRHAGPALAKYAAVSTSVEKYGTWLPQPTTVAVISGF